MVRGRRRRTDETKETMTILRPLSVMTPGPGDPEVAYAEQGTAAAREPVYGCTYMDKSRRQCLVCIYIYICIRYIFYNIYTCVRIRPPPVLGNTCNKEYNMSRKKITTTSVPNVVYL